MAAEKSQKSAGPDPASVGEDSRAFAGIDWKAQPVAIAALYGDLLAGAADQLRKQADFLNDLARCKDLPQALGVQASFVQGVWADTLHGAQKSFATMGKYSIGPSRS
jgi:hypothetical protein